MKAKSIVLSLPVKDLDKSVTFYRDAMQLEDMTLDGSIIMIELAGTSIFLIKEDDFETYTKKANLKQLKGGDTIECILSAALDTKEEVIELMKRIEKFGGTVAEEAKQEEWGYTGYFRDPDGHLWEIVATNPYTPVN